MSDGSASSADPSSADASEAISAAEALAETPFFAGLAAVDLARLVPELEELVCQPGETVFRQGDPAEGLYLIRSGTAGVSVATDDGVSQVVAALEAPAYFGEMGLLSDDRRSATVTALSPLELWKLPRERFDALVREHPRLPLELAAEMTRRLAQTTRRLSASHQEATVLAQAACEHLEPATRGLLYRAAVLPRFDARLLEAVARDAWSRQAFDWLAAEGLFFQPAERAGWLTFGQDHVRDVLLGRLEGEVGAIGVRELRRRAADALLARGDAALAADALELLVRESDWSRLERLLQTRWHELADREPSRLEACLRAIPGDRLWKTPTLVHLLARCYLNQGAPEQAVEVYRQAEQRVPEARTGRTAVGYQQALAELYQRMGRQEQALACLRRAIELQGRGGALADGSAQALADLPEGVDRDERLRLGELALAGARGLAAATINASLWRRTGAVRWIVGLVIVVATAGIWALPPPDGLSVAGLRVLVTVLASLLLSLLAILPEYLLALSMIVAWVLSGTLPANVATAGFSASTWFLLLASMAIGTAVARCGLLYRGALEIVRRLPPSHTVRCLTLTGLGLVFTPGMPNGSGRVALATPLAQDIADSLRYPPRSGGTAGLTLATYLGFGPMSNLFLTGSALSLIVYGLLPPEVQARMSWGSWFLAALPAHAVMLGLSLLFVLTRYRPKGVDRLRAETLAIQREVLGRLSRDEWSAMLVLAALLVGFASQSLHHIDPAWLALIAVVVLFLLGTLDDTSFRGGVNWSFMLFLGVILGYGRIFAHVELDRWLGPQLQGLADLAGGSQTVFVLLIAAIAALLGLILQPSAISILLGLTLYPTAAAMGISPWVVAMTILLTSCLWLYPQQSVVYLTAYFATGERGFSHAQSRPVAIVFALAAFLGVLVSIPYWRWLGLIT